MTTDTKFAEMRAQMVEDIAAHVAMTSGQIGRERLGLRILEAVAKVPRHAFVPLEIRGYFPFCGPSPMVVVV